MPKGEKNRLKDWIEITWKITDTIFHFPSYIKHLNFISYEPYIVYIQQNIISEFLSLKNVYSSERDVY